MEHQLQLKKPLAFFDLETTGIQLNRDRIVEISIAKANPDGSPHHHHYLPIVEIWNDLFDDEHPNIFEFTPGGHFSISKEQVLTRSLDFYKKIIILLETQEFAPWVIERLEPYIFNPHIKTKL
jgi:hypothetical protein